MPVGEIMYNWKNIKFLNKMIRRAR